MPWGAEKKEDMLKEKAFWDDYFSRKRLRGDGEAPESALWLERAAHPKSWPVDYWEYAFYLLGDIQGKCVLDLGCGSGWVTRFLGLKGAAVSAIDVSLNGCICTRKALRESGSHGDSVAVMDAHSLAFRDGVFQTVWVSGVLHHVNIEKAARENSPRFTERRSVGVL